jgi:hypothetical protein
VGLYGLLDVFQITRGKTLANKKTKNVIPYDLKVLVGFKTPQ